jgi:hypothetical protein
MLIRSGTVNVKDLFENYSISSSINFCIIFRNLYVAKAVLRIRILILIQMDPYIIGSPGIDQFRISIFYTDPDPAAFKMVTICHFFQLC